MSRVAVVTDSTAALTPQGAADLGVHVVPLHVLIDGEVFSEGVDIDTDAVLESQRRRRAVSTSRPSPAALLALYEELAAQGAQEIVSAHLSAQLSGTCDAAQLAARDAPVPVHVVDSRSAGAGLGLAVADGVRLATQGASAAQVAAVIERRARAATVLFYVHSLDHLRRGGRIGAAAGLLGGALAIKPLLALVDGHIEPVERLRTSARAVARLTELAAEAVAAAGSDVDIAVHHADARERAETVAQALERAAQSAESLDLAEPTEPTKPTEPTEPADWGERREPEAARVRILDLPAVLTVHLGPGTLAVVVSPRG